MKHKSRGNGQGSVYRSKDPRRRRQWAAVVTVGWSPAGRPIRVARYASSQREAERLRSRMVDALTATGRLPDDRVTMGTFLVDWFNARSGQLAPRSQRTYAHAIRRIAAHIGATRLVRLRPSTIEAMLAELQPATARLARGVLSAACADAVRDGLLERNPVALVRSQQYRPRTQRVPTAAEVRRIVEAADPADWRYVLTVVALTTGLRSGELRGLRWADIDGGTLRVARQVVGAEVGEPKTPGSIRTVALPPAAVDLLRRWRVAQAAPTGYVFGGRSPIAQHGVARAIDATCAAAGVAPFPPHSARRFVATVLAGDPKTAAMVLGHTSSRITLDPYARGTDEMRQRAADMIEEVVG